MQILYVQPYVPSYRLPLFNELAARLEARGDSLIVASGAATGANAYRQDATNGKWHTAVTSRSFKTPVGEFKHRGGLGRLIGISDICVMELDVGNLNAWTTLANRSHPPLILWGHGKAYTTPCRRISERLKIIQASCADHVMTYSESGRQYLISHGVGMEKVSSVGNSTDTASLREALADRLTRPLDRSEAFGGLQVQERLTAMYVGGLDADKRIHFLLDAAKHAHQLDKQFLLLVAGSGIEQPLVQAAVAEGYVAWIPRADVASLADMAAVTRAIWMPGRVGLIAIDAMALGKTVMTTPFRYHAPEFELLTPGKDTHVLSNFPRAFAAEALAAMDSHPSTRALSEDIPSIAKVAGRMLQVIDKCVASPSPRSNLGSRRPFR